MSFFFIVGRMLTEATPSRTTCAPRNCLLSYGLYHNRVDELVHPFGMLQFGKVPLLVCSTGDIPQTDFSLSSVSLILS